MRYHVLLEESYKAIREQAPPVGECQRLHDWLLSIGQLLALMPLDMRSGWADQYAALLVIKYGHISPAVATITIRHSIDEAAGRWPKPLTEATR